jgi:hypothetical protein
MSIQRGSSGWRVAKRKRLLGARTDLPFTNLLTLALLTQLTVWLGFWIAPVTSRSLKIRAERG